MPRTCPLPVVTGPPDGTCAQVSPDLTAACAASGLSLGDVPTRQPIGIVLTVLGVVVLDFSADATEGPIRAYLLDVVDSEEQDMALNIHAFSAGESIPAALTPLPSPGLPGDHRRQEAAPRASIPMPQGRPPGNVPSIPGRPHSLLGLHLQCRRPGQGAGPVPTTSCDQPLPIHWECRFPEHRGQQSVPQGVGVATCAPSQRSPVPNLQRGNL